MTVSGLTLDGTDLGNYTLTQPGTMINITALGLTVTGVTAVDRVYKGLTSVSLNTGSASLVGVISGDTVNLVTTGASGSVATKGIGTSKAVTVSGLTLDGTDSGNYTLTQPTTTVTYHGIGINGNRGDGN